MKLFKKILCLLGCHKWDYNYKKNDEYFYYRKCKNCKKEESCLWFSNTFR